MGKKTNDRCQPFSLSFHPNGKEEDDGPYRTRNIPPTATPVDVENSMFSGQMLLLHDTGNEPDPRPEADEKARKGVELRLQGKFARPSTTGELTSTGLWVGGELGDALKLGWIMKNIVDVCAKYARKKCEGRLHFVMGGKDSKTGKVEKPFLAFPIGQLFSIIGTPPGEEVPPIDSPEWDKIKWAMSTPEINTEQTYTLIFRTPYLDLYSWDLLKVPGVSPLPLESVLGDITTARVFLFDLGAAGSFKDWKNGALVEWHFARGEGPPEEEGLPVSLVESQPLEECESEPSDEEAEGMEGELQADEGTVVEADDVDSQSTFGSEDDADSLHDDEDGQLSTADSEALLAIPAWRPHGLDSEQDLKNVQIKTPYYIEAIDRRRRRKLYVWYVFEMTQPSSDPGFPDKVWWHAKSATELAMLCRPRRRLRLFRRGPGARRYAAYAVKTLEVFRQIVCQQLKSESHLKNKVLTSAANASIEDMFQSRAESAISGNADGTPTERSMLGVTPAVSEGDVPKSPRNASGLITPGTTPGGGSKSAGRSLVSPARLAGKLKEKRRHRTVPFPPRFFVAHGSTLCSVAFVRAKEGRKNVLREALVGAIQFEGRLCEELLRMSTDGTVRCFTPYDCDTPRVRLHMQEVSAVEKVEELMLGRFYVWKVHTLLRVFLFCCSSEQERQEWIDCFEAEIRRVDGDDPTMTSRTHKTSWDATPHEIAQKVVARAGNAIKEYVTRSDISQVATDGSPKTPKTSVDSLVSFKEARPTDITAFLTDATRARRWRPKRRLVLNDRVVISPDVSSPPPGIVAGMLETVLAFSDQPSMADLVAFQNTTCLLKAVRFEGWNQEELLAFWINVYHCLLLHGCALLGTPRSKKQQARFHARVSYLIGPYPLSLREIERVMLRVPKPDPKLDVARDKAAKGAKKMIGICGMCTRTSKAATTPKKGGSRDEEDDDDDEDEERPGKSGMSSMLQKVCMPSVKLPNLNLPFRQETTAVLFLGSVPARLEPLAKPDLKVMLCLNSGKLNCLKTIPVFNSIRLASELDDVARAFVAEFVKVEKASDGQPTRILVPQSILGIKKELGSEPEALLNFLWDLLPEDSRRTAPRPGLQIKFIKSNESPRRRSDFLKASFSLPELPQQAGVDGAAARGEPVSGPSSSKVSVSSDPAQTVREKGRLIQTIRL